MQGYVRTLDIRRELNEYIERHELGGERFSSRARAVDAVRLALASEPLSRPRPSTTWQREAEGVHHSRNGRWRLERGEAGIILSPLSREAREQVEANPGIRECCRESRSGPWSAAESGRTGSTFAGLNGMEKTLSARSRARLGLIRWGDGLD